MAVFFEGSAKHCCHTTLKLGSRGVELSSPDFKLVGCFFEEPGLRPGSDF